MNLFRLILVSSVILLGQLRGCTDKDRPQSYEVGEAYDLYSAILPNTTGLLIRDQTRTRDFCLSPLDQQAAQALDSAIKNYHELNDKPWHLERRFVGARDYELLPEEELDSTFDKGVSGNESRKGWESFFKRHPASGGWVEFSAVGFNESKTIAVVYIGYHCGSSCEGGEFKAMEKNNGKWQLLTGKGKWHHCIWLVTDHTV